MKPVEKNLNDSNNSNKKDKDELPNKSLLLAVPLYFYIEFAKIHYKSLLFSTFTILSIIFAYFYVSYSNITNTNQITWNNGQEIQKSTYIQQYTPLIYEDMLKVLQNMQQAAVNLQIKQQASDRKTLALQQQIYNLRKTAGVLNRETAREMIREALLVYDADKLGLRDFALEYFGGSILSTPSTIAKLSQNQFVFFGFFTVQSYSNPRVLIQPDVQPGKCFAFEGRSGKIRIKLSNLIFITAVTLEHASVRLLTKNEITSAPRTFRVYGFQTKNSEIGYLLGEFIYGIPGPPRQTFLITAPKEIKPYEIIQLEILNNYGNEDYTCVYRFRVHGHLSIINN